MSHASVIESFATEDHKVRDCIHALSFELQKYAQWFKKTQARHKKEMKKLKKKNMKMWKSMQAFMHQVQAGTSYSVPLSHVPLEQSSDRSSSSSSDPNDRNAHDVDPNVDPLDTDDH